MRMIDIHMHLIPGVDDGADNTEDALRMALRAYDQGINTIFATPHSNAFDEQPENTFRQYRILRNQLNGYFPGMKLLLGCEVYCESDRMAEITAALDCGQYPTMNGTEYVLVECSKWIQPKSLQLCTQALRNAGYVPIVAHLERYVGLRNRLDLVDDLLDSGCHIQVNAYSFFDEMEAPVKLWARRLATEGVIDFLGTDAHSMHNRPPSVKRGLDWLYSNCDPDYVDAIAWENARKVLVETL